jgi:hypothetical protein
MDIKEVVTIGEKSYYKDELETALKNINPIYNIEDIIGKKFTATYIGKDVDKSPVEISGTIYYAGIYDDEYGYGYAGIYDDEYGYAVMLAFKEFPGFFSWDLEPLNDDETEAVADGFNYGWYFNPNKEDEEITNFKIID